MLPVFSAFASAGFFTLSWRWLCFLSRRLDFELMLGAVLWLQVGWLLCGGFAV
jgi:hypothetical protein